jgi:hypothetical protein
VDLAPPRRKASLLAPLALSLVAHLGLLGLLAFGGRFRWPEPPIPIEVQTVHRATERTGPIEQRGDPRGHDRAARPKTTNSAARVTPRGPGEGAATRSLGAPPPETTDLAPFAPEGANLVVLLSCPGLRRSPHRAGLESLLAALPDYGTLVEGTGISPIDDLEALLIATADPRDMTATFLAARHRGTPRVSALADRPLLPGDPRVFRVLSPELIVLTRPDAAARLDDARRDGGSAERDASWLKELAEFDRAGQSAGAPAAMASLSEVPSLLRFGAGLPTPRAIAAATTADPSPAVRVKLVFSSEEEATRFAAAWPEILGRWRSATAFLGLAPAFDDFRLTRSGSSLDVAGHIPETQIKLGLAWARAALPHQAAPAPPSDPVPSPDDAPR